MPMRKRGNQLAGLLKMMRALMADEGLSIVSVAAILKVDRRTVYRYLTIIEGASIPVRRRKAGVNCFVSIRPRAVARAFGLDDEDKAMLALARPRQLSTSA